jgi:release factor glutamine methyltransferase
LTARELVDRAAAALARCGLPTPRLDAEVLLCHHGGLRRTGLYLDPDRTIDPESAKRFEEAVARRARGCPVAYLTGRKEFYSLEFRVDESVLIPRPETEHLVEEALRLAKELPERESLLAADVGTGSGAIAVSVARHDPRIRVVAVDVSTAALRTAAGNARFHGVADRIEFLCGDLLAPLGREGARARFDLVLSNPPYIADDEFDSLPPGVRDHEPALALRAGGDRFRFHRRLSRQARMCLRRGGSIVLEIGGRVPANPDDALSVLEGYSEVRLLEDYRGLPRVLTGRKTA